MQQENDTFLKFRQQRKKDWIERRAFLWQTHKEFYVDDQEEKDKAVGPLDHKQSEWKALKN